MKRENLATWQLVAWLIFVWPIGLWLVWNCSKSWGCAWSNNTKVTATIIVLVLIALNVIM